MDVQTTDGIDHQQIKPIKSSSTLTGKLYHALFGDIPPDETLALVSSDPVDQINKKKVIVKLNRITNAELDKYLYGRTDTEECNKPTHTPPRSPFPSTQSSWLTIKVL